jgi:hypothetical protein
MTAIVKKYFSDTNLGSFEIAYPHSIKNAKAAELFPGVRIKRSDSFSRLVGESADGTLLPVTRFVCYKAKPSLHACNSKCRGGKCGGTCECQCGGKNHGIGL